MAKINALLGFFTFIITVIFTCVWGLLGTLLALLLIQLLNCYLNYRLIDLLLVDYKNDIKKDKFFLKEILLFSLPISLQEGFYAIASWLISMLLIKYSNYAEFGLYSAALQWSTVILLIPASSHSFLVTISVYAVTAYILPS